MHLGMHANSAYLLNDCMQTQRIYSKKATHACGHACDPLNACVRVITDSLLLLSYAFATTVYFIFMLILLSLISVGSVFHTSTSSHLVSKPDHFGS